MKKKTVDLATTFFFSLLVTFSEKQNRQENTIKYGILSTLRIPNVQTDTKTPNVLNP